MPRAMKNGQIHLVVVPSKLGRACFGLDWVMSRVLGFCEIREFRIREVRYDRSRMSLLVVGLGERKTGAWWDPVRKCLRRAVAAMERDLEIDA